jgi:hypothetical protein
MLVQTDSRLKTDNWFLWKTITFSRSGHSVEFLYISGQMVLDRVNSIDDLKVCVLIKILTY